MSVEDPVLHETIRAILRAEGKIGTAILVARLQTLGFTSLPEIWKTLEQFERTGEARSGGPATRRTWELMPPPQTPGQRTRTPTAASHQAVTLFPDLEDPATFLDLASAPAPARTPTPAPPARKAEHTRPLHTSTAAPAPSLDQALPAPAPHANKALSAPTISVSPTAEVAPPRRRGGGRRREDKQIRHKGLTRCDYPERHMVGYMVRVAWAGERRQKFFADTKYGDRLGALTASLAWRDQQERELGKPRTEELIIGKAASNTGISGVTRLIRAGHPILQVTWYENGRQRRTSISVEKHGERAALALARRIRADAEQRRIGRPVRVIRSTVH